VQALAKRKQRSPALHSAKGFAAAETLAAPHQHSQTRKRTAGIANLRLGALNLFFLAVLTTSLFVACAKRPLSPSELRAITVEVVAASQRISTHKSEITIRPEVREMGDRKISTDHIYVTLGGDSEITALREALGAIARRHHLQLVESGASVRRFDFTFNGERTHSIHIVSPLAERSRPSPGRSVRVPRLAIIIDDLGNDRAAADALLSLPFPLTISVLPHLPLSSEIAEEAYRRNDQVMLHLPMESQGESAPSEGTKPEEIELRVGMNRNQVHQVVSSMIDTVPHVSGVNNHQGSRATTDAALMQAVMEELRARNLYFIDSRTTASTVAYDQAHAARVRAASRKVFLDDVPARDAILAQLDQAARDATRDGSAIAIGHPHPATIAALAEEAPRLEARGIRIVFASDLVQ